MRYFGFGQIGDNAIQQEISARGIRIEEPPPWEPPPDEPPPWEPPPPDDRPITPVVISPPVPTIPWTPLITEPGEDDLIDVLEPPEEKKAFVLSGKMIGLGLGLVVLLAMMGKGTERKALPAARRTPEPRALPAARTGRRVIVDI
jgi:hypothetical protein